MALALLAAGAAVSAAAAADGPRDTGRRRPVAVAPATPAAEDPATAAAAADDGRWQVGFAIGPADAGRLFRVETASGNTVPWGTGGREVFSASRFTAKLDPATGVAVHASRRLGDGPWRLRAEVGRAAGDIAADALLGQGGEVFRYDGLTFLTGALAAEARLTAARSHPYLSVGMTVCRMSAERETGLDQTRVGLQGALGFRQRVRETYIGLEVQARRIGMDLNQFRPSVAATVQPGLVYEPVDSLWLFELRLSLAHVW